MEIPSGPRKLPAADLSSLVKSLEKEAVLLANSRILLTGGTGFFGRWWVESYRALKRAHALPSELVIMTRDIKRASQVFPDLQPEEDIRFISSATELSGVFTHLLYAQPPTAGAGDRGSDDRLIAQDLETARGVFTRVAENPRARALFASSGAVYEGISPGASGYVESEFDPRSEKSATESSLSGYARVKRETERLAMQLFSAPEQKAFSARCFALLGPGIALDQGFAAGNFIRDAIQGKPIEIRGDGQSVRSYHYALDLAFDLWRLLLAGKNSGAYNVGSERAYSIAELAELTARVCGSSAGVKILGLEKNPLRSRYVPSIRKIRVELNGGAEPVEIEDAMARWRDWLSKA